MVEQELFCKEFGGLTDDQARVELLKRGIVVRSEDLDPDLLQEKIWKREVIRLCEYPANRYPRKVLQPEPMKVLADSEMTLPEPKALSLKYQGLKMVEMGYAHWVDDYVRGEPGNGYFVHYRWFYWDKDGPVQPLFG